MNFSSNENTDLRYSSLSTTRAAPKTRAVHRVRKRPQEAARPILRYLAEQKIGVEPLRCVRELLEHRAYQSIVIAEQQDQLALRLQPHELEVIGGLQMFGRHHVAYARVVESAHDCRIIDGMVVRNHDFVIGEGLIENRLDRRPQQLSTVVRRYDDTEEGLAISLNSLVLCSNSMPGKLPREKGHINSE